MSLTVANKKEVYKKLKGSFRKSKTKWRQFDEPYYSRGSVDFLEELLQPEFNAFEYGGGVSSFWIAERVKRLITIEHNVKWFKRIQETKELLDVKNLDIFLVTDFEQYPTVIQYFNEEYDIVFVDGRKRVRSVLYSIPKVKSGGYLLLDNYTRDRYSRAKLKLREKFENVYQDTHTAIWRRP